MIRRQDPTGNRTRRQASDRGEQEDEAEAVADLLEGRDLDNARGGQRDIRARCEAEDDGKYDSCCCCGGGDPLQQMELAITSL